MPGSSRPSIWYNGEANRWEVRGKGGGLITTFPDTSQAIGQIRRFVGSTAAVAVGLASMSVATLTGASGNVNLGDFVFVTAKTQNINGGCIGVSVPSNNLALLTIFGSLPAMGWDVMAIRPA